MTHTLPPIPPEPKPQGPTPLTDKALARLRAIAEGNGLDAKKIELLGTEEKQMALKARMMLTLNVTSTRAQHSGSAGKPGQNVQVVPSVADLPKRVTAMKEKMADGADWIREAVEQLKTEPGEGFGIERAEITLDKLAQIFQATQNCETCAGKGSQNCEACKATGNIPCKICQATGQELCYHCQGTGKNPAALPQPCPTCHGRGQVQLTPQQVCVPCHGRGQIQQTLTQNCPQCHGRGNLQRDVQQSCPSCHGNGRDPRDHNHPCHNCGGRGTVLNRVMQACEICHGRGQVQSVQSQACHACHGRGSIPATLGPCTQCHGKGTLPPNPQLLVCPICNGVMRILCRTCTGKKTIACPACAGKGKITCKTCGGAGKFTVEERALPVANCEFNVVEIGDVPSGLRRALDRFGLKMLAKVGAAISAEPYEQAPNKVASITYHAQFPFAEARLRINGKPLRATIVGEKASIRDIPPFMDSVFEVELQKLEKTLSGSNGLKKAFRLRAFSELFALMQEGGDPINAFRRLYPIGFSVSMIERMKALLDRLAEASTFTLRATVAGILLLLLFGGYDVLIAGGARAAFAKATHPLAAYGLDVVVCGASFLLIHVVLRFTAALQLRSLARGQTHLSLKAQHAGSLGMGVGICAVLAYVGLLWFLKATPFFLG